MGLFRPDYRLPPGMRKITWLHRLVRRIEKFIHTLGIILCVIVFGTSPLLIVYIFVRVIRLAWGS